MFAQSVSVIFALFKSIILSLDQIILFGSVSILDLTLSITIVSIVIFAIIPVISTTFSGGSSASANLIKIGLSSKFK